MYTCTVVYTCTVTVRKWKHQTCCLFAGEVLAWQHRSKSMLSRVGRFPSFRSRSRIRTVLINSMWSAERSEPVDAAWRRKIGENTSEVNTFYLIWIVSKRFYVQCKMYMKFLYFWTLSVVLATEIPQLTQEKRKLCNLLLSTIYYHS